MRPSLTGVSIAALCMISIQDAPAQWPQFGGPAGNFCVKTPLGNPSHLPTKRWQQTLGPGMAGVVAQDGIVFTSFLKPFDEASLRQPEPQRAHREVVVAFDADDGAMIWRHEYDSGWIDSQQAFGGRPRSPQATPAVCGDYLVTIGFTGIIHCFEKTTGEVVWRRDAVNDFAATPVQFGFAASPVSDGDRVFLLTGGDKGGLICLDAETGNVIWNLPSNEASYATPVLWNRKEGKQVVATTRNRVFAADAASGKQLWEYTLPEQGLTNVPTPMPIGESALLISGQGVLGTRLLDVTVGPTGLVVTETWKNAAQFFYCNWVVRGDHIFGSDGDLLLALDRKSGETVGRFRGFNNANLLLMNERLLILHGDGHLSAFTMAERAMKAIATFSVLNERCWTPPTPNAGLLYCRGGDQLLCLDMVGGDPRAAVTHARVRKQVLEFGESKAQAVVDPMDRIISAFESDGADAARKQYLSLRDQDPDGLPYAMRVELSELAKSRGLHDFAKRIMKHAAEDFPQAAQQALRKPSKEPFRGENGLIYVELLISNTSQQTIQAEVEGPRKHPFGYGLPIRPGKPRLEKWPVGSKLYEADAGDRGRVLFTVGADFAGRTIEVPGPKE